jgi:hypothetical protein
LFFFNTMRSGQLLTWRDGDKVLGIALKNKVETFYGANTNFLSGCDLDKILFWQGTWDFTLETAIEGVIMSRGVGRIKTRWGNPDSIIRTTEAVTQVAGVSTLFFKAIPKTLSPSLHVNNCPDLIVLKKNNRRNIDFSFANL